MLYIWRGFLLSFPLLVGGILHMIAVKKDFLPFLKIPINRWAFGENKTLRGFIIMPLATLIGTALVTPIDSLLTNNDQIGFSIHWILFGLGLGFFYVLFELPNSFIKRRMGVAPGKTSEKNKLLFILLDHIDSGFGVGLFYYLFINANIPLIITGIIIGAIVHLITNYVLHKFGIRKEKI